MYTANYIWDLICAVNLRGGKGEQFLLDLSNSLWGDFSVIWSSSLQRPLDISERSMRREGEDQCKGRGVSYLMLGTEKGSKESTCCISIGTQTLPATNIHLTRTGITHY